MGGRLAPSELNLGTGFRETFCLAKIGQLDQDTLPASVSLFWIALQMDVPESVWNKGKMSSRELEGPQTRNM